LYFLQKFNLNDEISSQFNLVLLSEPFGSDIKHIWVCPLLSSLFYYFVGFSLGKHIYDSGAIPKIFTPLFKPNRSTPFVIELSTIIASVLKQALAIPA